MLRGEELEHFRAGVAGCQRGFVGVVGHCRSNCIRSAKASRALSKEGEFGEKQEFAKALESPIYFLVCENIFFEIVIRILVDSKPRPQRGRSDMRFIRYRLSNLSDGSDRWPCFAGSYATFTNAGSGTFSRLIALDATFRYPSC